MVRAEVILTEEDLSQYSNSAIRDMAELVWGDEKGGDFWRDIYTQRLMSAKEVNS